MNLIRPNEIYIVKWAVRVLVAFSRFLKIRIGPVLLARIVLYLIVDTGLDIPDLRQGLNLLYRITLPNLLYQMCFTKSALQNSSA